MYESGRTAQDGCYITFSQDSVLQKDISGVSAIQCSFKSSALYNRRHAHEREVKLRLL